MFSRQPQNLSVGRDTFGSAISIDQRRNRMDTQTQAWLDQLDAYITEVIRRHDWFTAPGLPGDVAQETVPPLSPAWP